MSVLLGLKAANLADAAEELVPKALHGAGKPFLKAAKIAQALKENIKLGSVEFHRGLAFLYLRVDDLHEPRAAMGISADGLNPGGNLQERVFVVVLFLRPKREPGYDVPLWARRRLCNERTIYKLRKAPDIEAAFNILQEA